MASQKETRVVELIINGKQAELSLKQLKGEVISLTTTLSKMKEADDPKLYKQKLEELKKVNNAYKEMRAEINGTTTATQRFWQNAKQIGAGVLIGNLMTQATMFLGSIIPDLIRHNEELSDSFADVAKTTGLTIKQVESLSKRFKDLDTRTSRKELLQLAHDAGKLGISGSDNIYQFVKAANEIKVALGDDLGDGAIKNIGKLVNIFRLDEQFGLEKAMLKMGSAVNELGMASTANEDYMVDFLKRLGGIAPLANISADQALALGATLDSLGQTSEVSSTALSKLFVKMASDASTYAKIAKVSVGEFTQVMNRNALEALIMVLKAAGETKGGIVQLTNTLGELGIEGGRATGVFGVLANNIDKLKTQMNISNKAFEEGTSITNEYNIKNTNLAANIEKLQKKIAGLYTNSKLNVFIGNVVKRLNEWTEAEKETRTELEKTLDGMNLQIEVLKRGDFNFNDRVRLIGEINRQYGEYLPQLLTESDTLDEINRKQAEGNKLLYGRILLQRYEGERKKIVDQMLDAQDALFQGERNRQELLLDNTTGFTATQKKAIMDGMKAVDDFNKATIDGTSAKLDELNAKFEAMAKNAGIKWSEIINPPVRTSPPKTNPEDYVTPPGGPAGADNSSSKTKQKTAAEIAAEMAEEEYRTALASLKNYLTERQNILGKDYLEGKIDYEDYLHKKDDLDLSYYEYKMNLDELYKKNTVESENDFINALIRLQEKREKAHGKSIDNMRSKEDDFEQVLKQYLKHAATEALGMLGSLKDLNSQLFSNELETNLREYQAMHENAIKGITAAYEAGAISREKYDSQIAAADATLAEQTSTIRRQQWESQKEADIANAQIRGVIAFLQALTTPPGPPITLPLAAFAAGIAAKQVELIRSQPTPQFAAGGVTVTGAADGRRYRATPTRTFAGGGYVGTPTLGLIGEMGPELVIPNWLYSEPRMANVMLALEGAIAQRGIPQFAAGGSTVFTKQDAQAMMSTVSTPTQDPQLASLLAKLLERLDQPIEAVTLFKRQEYDEYVKLEDRAKAAGRF